MVLNRSDFPEMTDDQWKMIEAENDRRAKQASDTARKGLLKPDEVQKQIAEAVEEERRRLEADEAGRLQMEREAFEKERQSFAAERRSLTAKTMLTEAGLPAEKVDAILPLVANVGDDALASTLDAFISVYQDSVKAAVDKERQTLLGNATAPATGIEGPTDASAKADELFEAGDTVGGLDALLEAAGYA